MAQGKSAFQYIFKDTLIGVAIGWGGFAALLPNILGSISEVNELGNFISLRLFSMAFFLLPVLMLTSYWWFAGANKYMQYVNPANTFQPRFQRLVSASFTLSKIVIPVFFISNQFFLYDNKLGMEVPAVSILWLYCLLAVLEMIWAWWTTRGVADRRSFLIACSLIFSMDLIFGIGIMAFIEPWVMYRAGIQYQIVIAAFIFLHVCLATYFLPLNGNRNLSDLKNLIAVHYLLLLFCICFPALSWDPRTGIIAISISTVSLLAAILWRALKDENRIEALKRIVSTTLGTIFLAGASMMIVGFYSGALLKANRHYMIHRKEASQQVSGKKVFPLLAYSENLYQDNCFLYLIQSSYSHCEDLNENELKRAIFWSIANSNHLFADSVNGRSLKPLPPVRWHGLKTKVKLDSLSKNWNVRKTFYGSYEGLPVEPDSIYRNSYNHDTITYFYSKVYENIEKDILKEIILPAKRDEYRTFMGLERFYHPINYYSETLKRYKSDLKSAQRVQSRLAELNMLDTLSKISPDTLFYVKARNKSRDEIVQQFNAIQGFDQNDMLSFGAKLSANKKSIDLDSYLPIVHAFTPFLVVLKHEQYAERYRRAQIIFRAYLVDSQRVGLFVLFYVLAALFLLYFIHLRHHQQRFEPAQEAPEEKPQGHKGLDDLPGGFLNIAISVLIVLTIQVARPVKAENINPEDPYWMMDLENWYAPTVIDRAIGVERNQPQTQGNVLNEALKSYEELKKVMQESNGNLKEIKDKLE